MICCVCLQEIKKDYNLFNIFNDAFSQNPKTVYVHTSSQGQTLNRCLDKFMQLYFVCPICGRIILNCSQNYIQLIDSRICLSCFDSQTLNADTFKKEYEQGAISGIPLKDDISLKELGYKHIGTYKIDSHDSGDSYCGKALDLIGQGKKVISVILPRTKDKHIEMWNKEKGFLQKGV